MIYISFINLKFQWKCESVYSVWSVTPGVKLEHAIEIVKVKLLIGSIDFMHLIPHQYFKLGIIIYIGDYKWRVKCNDWFKLISDKSVHTLEHKFLPIILIN